METTPRNKTDRVTTRKKDLTDETNLLKIKKPVRNYFIVLKRVPLQ